MAHRRILIIQTAFIGDVILATPVIEKLRRYHPSARIDILVRKGQEPLFKDHPKLDRVLTWDKGAAKYRALAPLAQSIRRRRYDDVINLQRFTATGLLSLLSGARQRVGFNRNPLALFYTRRIPHRMKPGLHEIDRNLALVAHMTGPGRPLPRLYPSASDFAAVRAYQKASYITIAPASVWATKQFPLEKWIAFIKALSRDDRVLLIGSGRDAGMCRQIEAAVRGSHLVSLAGKLSLLESAALMRDARMNYVNDSAPLHIASAMNAPTAAVFCSTVPAFGFGPLSDQSRLIECATPLACRPCGIHGRKQCPLKTFDCARLIDTQQLLEPLLNPSQTARVTAAEPFNPPPRGL